MKVSYLNALKLFLVIVLFINVSNEFTFKYTNDGVYRENGECNLTFVNFGTKGNLSDGGKITPTNKNGKKFNPLKEPDVKPFDVRINNLYNGNIGLNNNSEFSFDEIKNYVEITQKIGDTVKKITDFEILENSNNSKFDLKINNIDTCEGIIIKQLFKEKTVVVANRLYYENVVPTDINHRFDPKKFGPSYDYPFNRIHWKINEGLDDLRKSCGIYMYYGNYDSTYVTNDRGETSSPHWEYYLSPSRDEKTINAMNCTTEDFFKVIKRNYIDYHYTEELLGENYMGYVLKREGNIELHMDGIIADNGYLVEMYQESCNPEFNKQTSCTLRSKEKLTFNEFVYRYATECLKINLAEEEEEPQWVISNKVATGTFKHQIITIKQPDSTDVRKGELPTLTSENLKYYEFSRKVGDADYVAITPVARFTVSFECKDGSFRNNDCKCELCPINCKTCTSRENCTECKNEEFSELENGKCKNKPGYFEDEDGENKKCDNKCLTCDIEGCLSCDSNAGRVLENHQCVCDTGYVEINGVCKKCNDGCATCNKDGTCITCIDDEKRTAINGVCQCKKSYYKDLTTGECEKCDIECAECNRKGYCTVCKDRNNTNISDGTCVCKKSYLKEDGTCFTCDAGCLKCDKEKGCLACIDRSKTPVDGHC